MIEIPQLQMRLKLSKTMAQVVKILLENQYVTAKSIEKDHAVVSDAKVLVHRLRKRLYGQGIAIQSRRDVGYWFDESSRAEVYKALGAEASVGQAEEDDPSESEVHQEH